MQSLIVEVTQRIRERSAPQRLAYLARVQRLLARPPGAQRMGCANVAHAFAALPGDQRLRVVAQRGPNLAVVTAYNDMLSAHQPYESYPALIRDEARRRGATVQVAGGVPAMCDGVTQGLPGMELSLFSRDAIAQATAIALSHDVFEGALLLGVCDKIVPGLLIGALHFGHLPCVFVPAGPMSTGLSNGAKSKVREQFAQGLVGREALLEAEQAAYHGAGTCTFYGTANSNQMLMEIMGLHLPGSAFVNPGTPLREALTRAATQRAAQLWAHGSDYRPLAQIVDERAIVNAIVGLLATGGSTNHTIHLVAMARAAGVVIDWDDFNALSAVVPLIARVYPNGAADVNHFHAAGGMAFVIRELLGAGLLHADVKTICGTDLRAYTQEPWLDAGKLAWREGAERSGDTEVLRPVGDPFSLDGGLKLLTGNLGRSVIKVSAVKPERRCVEAPARIFETQEAVSAAFEAGELHRDVIVVVRGQGPRANGMPELHKLTPALAALQAHGHKVALVTDGRMSGASGSVPAAIHVSPEVHCGGPLGKLRDGDIVRLDSNTGTLDALVTPETWAGRTVDAPATSSQSGMGRELFSLFRAHAATAEQGGGVTTPAA